VEHSSDHHEVLNDSSTSAYRDPLYLAFIFFVALYATVFFQIFASVPQYFNKVCHYNEDTIGLLMALNGFLVVLIEMPLVHRMEHKKEIFPFIIAGTLCLPLCFLFLLFGNQLLIWAIVYTIIITFSEILAMPFMMNYALSRPPKPRQGQYAALYSIAYGIANICAPIVGLGSADRWGFENMFYLLIGMGLFTMLGFWFLAKKSAA
jgi:predicted MFS family arabinose efflux permease